MRGGAIPILAWGTLLLVLYIGNWIWEGRYVQAAETLFAVLIIYAGGVLLWLVSRGEAIRKGPPPPTREPRTVPLASTGAVLAGLSVAAIVFGLAWAHFLVYFGLGALVLSLGRLAQELASERKTRSRSRREAGQR